MEKNILTINSVSKDYCIGEFRVSALQNVSFAVREKSFTTICGPSGSGKSTLLNILGTLDSPDAGEVYLEGRLIDYHSPRMLEEIRQTQVGFIFQTFSLIPVLSAFENVELPLLVGPGSAKERRERAEHYLGQVGLADRRNHRPHELSGGQQQRVAIARALVSEPKIIFADEPTANLDSRTTLNILELMSELMSVNRTSFLVSTHDNRVMQHATKRLVLRDGIIQAGETDAVHCLNPGNGEAEQ